MMNQSTIFLLLLSALSVGVVHTLLGPDHYLPFIVLAKSRRWTMVKTIMITLLCGIGHIMTAVVLCMVAISIGWSLNQLNLFEVLRGDIAVWILIGFGFAYFICGIRAAIRNRKHSHFHQHADGTKHAHNHGHHDEHGHIHTSKSFEGLTPWVLFVIFILGPCEPLIPLIMYPVIQVSILNVFLVMLVFGVGTLFVMLFMVLISVYGAKRLLQFPLLERYGNAVAGSIICGCGLAIKFLGI